MKRRPSGKLAERVDRADVRVVEGRGAARLAFEADQARRIAREGRGQDLHGDLAAEAAVPREVHLAHPAPAERRENLAIAEYIAVGQHSLRDRRPALVGFVDTDHPRRGTGSCQIDWRRASQARQPQALLRRGLPGPAVPSSFGISASPRPESASPAGAVSITLNGLDLWASSRTAAKPLCGPRAGVTLGRLSLVAAELFDANFRLGSHFASPPAAAVRLG